MTLKSVKLNLLVVYLVAYGGLACYFPFLAVYFESRGLSYIQSGIAFSATSLVSILAQPFMGYIADKYLSKKQVIVLNMILSSLLIFLHVFASGFYLVLLAIILLIFFQSSILSILDAYCYDISDHVPEVNFGQIRFMGSIGFAVVSLLLGGLIQSFGSNVAFYLYSAFFLSSALILSGIGYKSSANIVRPAASDIMEVLKNYKFMLFVLSVLILNITLQAHSSYVAMLVEATGGNVANLGIVWFITALSEIPAFFFGARFIKKHGELNVYILALILYIVRMLLSAFSSSYMAVIAIQLMQSITFPLYLSAAMQYTNNIVPEKVRASGITFLSSFGFGLGGLIGNLGGGLILQYSDAFFLYKVMTIICAVALAVALILKYKTRND